MFNRIVRDESGQDMVEYALLASLVSIVAIEVLRTIGPAIDTIFQNVKTALG